MPTPARDIVPVLVWGCAVCRRPVDFTIGIGPEAFHMGRRMDAHFAGVHDGHPTLGYLSDWYLIRPQREGQDDA